MYDCSTIIYDRDDYEKELRKLVRCEEEPGHPITSYGRERERVRKLLESSTEYFSKSLFPNSKISSLLTYNVEQSEFKFHNDGTLLDSSLQKGVLPDNSLFCEKSKSESLIQYIVEEIFYRALELIAVQYFPEAREVLGYKGDTDGRVYEMYSRIKTKSKEEWLPVMPSLLKKKGQLAIVNEISLIISHYALSLFFGAMQDIPIPGIFERCFDLTNSLKFMDKEVKRIFPEKGYAAIGIKSSLEFAQGYNKFLHSTAPLAPNFKYPYMPNISIINPMIITIKQEGINFYKLTLDTTQLRDFLECCLKRNGTKYVEEAIKQWKTGEANYADGRTEVLQPHEPLQDREEEMEYLRDKLSRIEAEAEVLRNELRERDGQVKKLQRELEKQSQERKQILQEQKEHAKNQQALMNAHKKQADVIIKEKDKQIAKLDKELKMKEQKIADMVKEWSYLTENQQTEKPFPKEREELLKKKISSLREKNKSLKEKLDLFSRQELPQRGSELMDQIISSLRHYESDLYDSGLVNNWTQIEMLLTHIFNNVPEVMKAIRQMHNDRLRLVKEQKKKGPGNPTVFINENKGPILTGNTDKKTLKPTDE